MNLEVDGGIDVVASELKSPIELIRQMALFLDENKPEQTREFRERIVCISNRSMRELDDIRLLERVRAGRIELEPVSVRSACEETKMAISEIYKYSERRLRLKMLRGDRLVIGERKIIESLIYRLAVDATNYANEDGEILLSVQERGGVVRIGVRDFGPILPAGWRARIASGEMGEVKKVPLRPDMSGTGIMVASELVRYMGGRCGTVRHADGMSFFFELRKSGQEVLF